MGRQGANELLFQPVRLAALAVGCLALANCSGGFGKVDPKYGVSASARVVEPGEPVPKGGGVYRIGKPYTVAGRVYVPEENTSYRAEGMASWYGDDFHGRYTANGEVFDMNSISAAHPTLPLPSYVRVTNLRNHRSLIVRINDRGPYANNRIIDLSVRSAKLLGFYGHGLAPVRVEYVGKAPIEGSDDRKLEATLRENGRPMNGEPSPVRVASAKPFVPEMFDARPMTQVPPPPERPYAMGEGDGSVAGRAVEAKPLEAPAVAASRPQLVRRAAAEPAPVMAPPAHAEPRLTSPVSAYAPVKTDSPAGFVSGRGLY